jgi:hypothetical protein
VRGGLSGPVHFNLGASCSKPASPWASHVRPADREDAVGEQDDKPAPKVKCTLSVPRNGEECRNGVYYIQ